MDTFEKYGMRWLAVLLLIAFWSAAGALLHGATVDNVAVIDPTTGRTKQAQAGETAQINGQSRIVGNGTFATPAVTSSALILSATGSGINPGVTYSDTVNLVEASGGVYGGVVVFGSVTSHALTLRTNNASRVTIAATTGDTSVASTTSASASNVGAFQVGNGTAATTTAIGGGNVNTGGSIISGTTIAAGTALSSGTTISAGTTISSTGNATFGNGSAAESVIVNGAAASSRDVRFQTAGSLRWFFGADSTAESGSDAGSNYFLTARTDAGANIDSPISITRATGGAIIIGGNTKRPVTLGNGSAPAANTFAGNTIWGVNTAGAASAGQVGEVLSAGQSTYTNFTTTATYQQLATIALTAGDWDIRCTVTFNDNSATLTANANAIAALSTTTASAAGTAEGRDIVYVSQTGVVGSTNRQTVTFTTPVNISATTNYFLNAQATFTAGNPQYTCYMSARRQR